MHNGFALLMEMKNASVSYPDKVLPAASIIVPDKNNGSFLNFKSLKNLMYAKIAALAFNVSKIVSMKMIWEPPSTRPWIYS
jgi:hypothetical protein